LFDYVIEGNIDETIKDFNNYLGGMNLTNLNYDSITKIYKWFDDEYRPQVISNNILKPVKISKKLSQTYYIKLKNFQSVCEGFLTAIKEMKCEELQFESNLIRDIEEFVELFKQTMKELQVDN